MLHLIQEVTRHLCSLEENGEELTAGFQRIPNRRVLPDYFEIISEPIAFSTIRSKIQRKQYTAFPEFVKDVAQICHNAQVYNRPSAPIFGAAVRLRQHFLDELKNLVTAGDIPADSAELPDLGELPPAEDSSLSGFENGGADDDEEEDEDDEHDEHDVEVCSEADARRRRNRRFRSNYSQSSLGPKDRDEKDGLSGNRGRLLVAPTPTEVRITSIINGLGHLKNGDGELLITPFEKLPDKSLAAAYYRIVTQPISMDCIKQKVERKTYQSVHQLLSDLRLMFENAKLFNEERSSVYEAANELQRRTLVLAEREMARPDDDFRDDEGRLPLQHVEHGGQTWRTGDWVHIRNPNDLAKPIVAQIFRIWQDRADNKWVNACWYYRPEQTVHRYEKHFFDREVVKTGQYRDHLVEELLDRCFVMFVTRFSKGRPRGLPQDKEIYVCESRYNEDNFRFNKIKSWPSCLPDEIRDKNYEIDSFDMPTRLKKVPSPIKHLLRDDAKEADEFPRPTWGSQNAPPIVGAVHRRPLESHESPPPQPTPPPIEASATTDLKPSMFSMTRETPAGGSARPPFLSPGQYSRAQMTPQYHPATLHLSHPIPRVALYIIITSTCFILATRKVILNMFPRPSLP
ncbi:RSC complex subunit RSC1 [Ophiocordyceps camponoti-floridani]|uniref:RSC complex subunit RSC1 n=1 Tax=Ophiocordyceps camponoti-floridani TaxID=2030778 RepID=A0A8H4VE95_9HYPO|nr:RSC complex subunit RSC1 [Ophiocordyceps camponoti-floridani]